jgi:hypothetical protein
MPQTTLPNPYFGISKLSCFQCTLYFLACRALKLGLPYETCGSCSEAFACALPSGPSGSSDMDENIEQEMESQLDVIIGKLISAEIKRGKDSMSSVDSGDSSEYENLFDTLPDIPMPF